MQDASRRLILLLCLIMIMNMNASCWSSAAGETQGPIAIKIVADERNAVPLWSVAPTSNTDMVQISVSVLLINRGPQDVMIDKTFLRGDLLAVPSATRDVPADADGPPQSFVVGRRKGKNDDDDRVTLRRDESYGRCFRLMVTRGVPFNACFIYDSLSSSDQRLWRGKVQDCLQICLPQTRSRIVVQGDSVTENKVKTEVGKEKSRE